MSMITDKHHDLTEQSDINVTPFIDVILVLLIIFMVAAPLATVDAPLDLPESHAETMPKPDVPVRLSITADDRLMVGDQTVLPTDLISALDRACGQDRDTRIFVHGDKTISYGRLMAVMDQMRQAGYLKLALVGQEAG